jgi:flagellar assembly protein FliH
MTRTQNRIATGHNTGIFAELSFGGADQASARFAAKVKAQELAEAQDLEKAKELARENAIREAGFSDGYTQGHQQGHAQATLEGQRQINEYINAKGQEVAREFGGLFELASQQIEQSQQVMAKGVLELACELARQVLRHELSNNPNAVLPVLREALGVLVSDSKAALVRLHPLDLEVLADVVRQEFAGLSLTLLADHSLERGGCLVESAGTVVDATVQKRWSRVVATLGLESAWEVADDER